MPYSHYLVGPDKWVQGVLPNGWIISLAVPWITSTTDTSRLTRAAASPIALPGQRVCVCRTSYRWSVVQGVYWLGEYAYRVQNCGDRSERDIFPICD